MTARRHLRPFIFGTGVALAAFGMVVSIALFLAMLASMQVIQNRLPDSAALSIMRLGQEVELLSLHWQHARAALEAGAQDGRAAAAGPELSAFLQGVDILVARLDTILQGRLYGYLDHFPDMDAPTDGVAKLVGRIDAAIQAGHHLTAEGRGEIDAAIRDLARETGLFVGLIQRTRDTVIAQGLQEISVFRWLVAGAILLSVGSALMLTFVVWRQNRRLLHEGLALMEARREAERARNETELAMRSRTQLFANTSHELRTPLNAIMGFSEIMATEALGRLGNDRYRGYCHDIHGSAQVLLELVDDLLLLGAVEEGKYDLSLEPVPVNPILARIRSMMGLKAVERGIALQFEVEEGLWVRGEARAIRQILVNLLDNAIKYSPRGSVVRCAVLGTADAISFQVEDNGPGIPDDQLEDLFQPFQRGEDAFVRQTKGAGLGLAIVKALASRMETAVMLGRGAEGGLCAAFRLPRLPGPPPAQPELPHGLAAQGAAGR